MLPYLEQSRKGDRETAHAIFRRHAVMKINIIGGGPGGALLCPPDEAARTRARDHGVRARRRRTTRSAGASSFPTRRSPTSRQRRAVVRRASSPAARRGITSTSSTGPDVTIRGNRFSGIAPHHLPEHPARALRTRSASTCGSTPTSTDPTRCRDCDLLVGADGANSPCASAMRLLSAEVDSGPNKYIWLGTHSCSTA